MSNMLKKVTASNRSNGRQSVSDRHAGRNQGAIGTWKNPGPTGAYTDAQPRGAAVHVFKKAKG